MQPHVLIIIALLLVAAITACPTGIRGPPGVPGPDRLRCHWMGKYPGAHTRPDTLTALEWLIPGQRLVSPNGYYTLALERDALVLHGRRRDGYHDTTRDPVVAWSMATDFPSLRVAFAVVTIVNERDEGIWTMDTRGARIEHAVRLVLQDDGNLVLYDGHNTSLWASGTQRHDKSLGALFILLGALVAMVIIILGTFWVLNAYGATLLGFVQRYAGAAALALGSVVLCVCLPQNFILNATALVVVWWCARYADARGGAAVPRGALRAHSVSFS